MTSKLKLKKDRISFFKDKTTTNPTISLSIASIYSSNSDNLILKLPNSIPIDTTNNVIKVGTDGQMSYTSSGNIEPLILPDTKPSDNITNILQVNKDTGQLSYTNPLAINISNRIVLPSNLPSDNITNILKVDKDTGQLEYTDSGTTNISGTYEKEEEGAVGIVTGSTIDSTFGKVDDWIFKNLVNKPPKPDNFILVECASTYITFVFDKPTIYQLGILNTTIPFITTLNIDIYKAINGNSNDLTGTITADNGTTLITGNSTTFLTELHVGDSITIIGQGWTTGNPKVKGSNTGTTLITDGWVSNPSSLNNNIFSISGLNGEYKISSITGTYTDVNSEITLILDRSLINTPVDNLNLIHQEVKTITKITNNTSLTVNSNIINSVSGSTATFIKYSSSISGTITTTLNSNIITGDSTSFTTELSIGDNITIDNNITKKITNISSNTSLTVDNDFLTVFTNKSCSKSIRKKNLSITNTDYLPREGSSNIVEGIKFFLNGGSTALGSTITIGSNTKRLYNLLDSTLNNSDKLRFEIYYDNYNSALNNNILFITNQTFKTAGIPTAPQNLSISQASSTSVNLTWSAPIYNDTTTNSSSEPTLDRYKITYSSNALSTGINKYNSASNSITYTVHGTQTVYHTNVDSRSLTISNLYTGQQYIFDISVKNSLNSSDGDDSDGYSDKDTESIELTTLPTTNTKLNTFNLTNPATTYTHDNNARIISNHTQLSNKVINYNLLSSFTTYSSLINVGVNINQTNIITSNIKFQSKFGNNGTLSNDGTATTFKSFNNPHDHSSSGNDVTNTNTKIKLFNQTDKYSDTYQEGFWSELDIDLSYKNTSVPATDTLYYNIGLDHLFNSVLQTSITSDKFYVDDLNNNSSINLVSSITFTDSNQFDISGIPSRGDNFQITYNFDIQYLGRYFIRYDKLSTAYLRFNSGNISSSTIYEPSSLTNLTYSDGVSITSGPINSSKYIRLQEIITYNNTDIHTNTNNISLKITPHNLLGDGTTFEKSFINGSNEFDNSGKYIYVDTISKNILDNYFNIANNTSGNPAINYPVRKLLTNNNTPTPSIASSADIISYDDSELIVGNSVTNYNYELQYVNGRFKTKASSDAFLNYPSNYLNHSSKNMTDYSAATSSEFRYTSLLYDLSGNPQKNINYIDIIFNNYDISNTTVASTGVINSSHYKIYIKLIDNNNYTPNGTDYTSIWLDGNTILSAAVTKNQTNYSNAAKEPLAALENTSSGNTNTTNTKRIILAAGTDTDNLKILIRVGLLNSVDINFSYLTVKYSN